MDRKIAINLVIIVFEIAPIFRDFVNDNGPVFTMLAALLAACVAYIYMSLQTEIMIKQNKITYDQTQIMEHQTNITSRQTKFIKVQNIINGRLK